MKNFKANDPDFFKQENLTTFHATGYGWNYFYINNAPNGIQVGRYFTNGHNNSQGTISQDVKYKAPKDWEECEAIYNALT